MNITLLTPQGLETFKKELNELVETKRPEAVTRLSKARDMGDLSENGEYVAARDELNFLDGRITELKELIKNATIIQHDVNNHKVVEIGSKVKVHIEGKETEFNIVGEQEADPMKKLISHVSPIGKALLGKGVGDEVEIDVPAGKIIYKILHIE